MSFWDSLSLILCTLGFPLSLILLWATIKSFLDKSASSPPPSTLTKEEEAADAMLGDVVGREMGWWD